MKGGIDLFSSPPLSSSRKSARLLAILNEEESRTFFPDGLDTASGGICLEWKQVLPGNCKDLENLIREYSPAVILGAWSTPLLPEVDGEPPAPYYCHVCGSVRNQIPRTMIEKGMVVTNWGNTVAAIVAETGLMLALASLRNLTHHFYAVHLEAAWRRNTPIPAGSLYGARIGIHGLGLIGQELSDLLKPFRARVCAYDPYQAESVFMEKGVSAASSLEELFSSSDVLFECCALTDKTHGIVSRSLLESMPEHALFVNVARGKLVDQLALAERLKKGLLRAGLDVFDNEPIAVDSTLRGERNLVATPHIGGNTANARARAGRVALENIDRFLKGEALTNTVSPEQFDMMT